VLAFMHLFHGGISRLLSRNTTKHRANRHPHASGIALAQYVAGIDFTGSVQIRAAYAVKEHTGMLIGLKAKVGECHARAHGVGIKRWLVQWQRPMGLGGGDALGVAVIEHGVVKLAG